MGTHICKSRKWHFHIHVFTCAKTQQKKKILLQWKILHKIYPCNKYLHQIKLSESELCIVCNNVDALEHFFGECTIIKRLWSEVEQDMHRLLETRVKFKI